MSVRGEGGGRSPPHTRVDERVNFSETTTTNLTHKRQCEDQKRKGQKMRANRRLPPSSLFCVAVAV